jgi:putative DNA-invertase from lambdoid prophage Rac
MIVVWKFDRFGRSLQQLVRALNELQTWGVGFISLRDSVDLSTPQDRLMYGIISAMSEFERELIKECVQTGVRRAIAKRESWGHRCLVIDAGKVDEMRHGGMSWSQISGELRQTACACRRAHARYLCRKPSPPWFPHAGDRER